MAEQTQSIFNIKYSLPSPISLFFRLALQEENRKLCFHGITQHMEDLYFCLLQKTVLQPQYGAVCESPQPDCSRETGD